MNEKDFYEQLEEVKNSQIVDTNDLPFYMLNINFFRNNEDYTVYERLVYIDLACYAGSKKNTAFPSIKTIANNIGISYRSVTYAMKSLQEKNGVLAINRVWDNKAKTSNMYVLASIDLDTGKFKPETLIPYKKFKEQCITVFKDKKNKE